MSEMHGSEQAEAKLIPGLFESLGKKLDGRPEVQATEEAVRLARDQVLGARRRMRRLRRQTVRRFRRLGSKSLGDLATETAEFARAHGDAVAAGLFGFLLGRVARR